MRLGPSLALGTTLAIAMPAVAQQTTERGGEPPSANVAKQWVAAYNKRDAAAVAALYSENATEVTPNGIIQGRDAVQKRIEADLQKGGHDLSIAIKQTQTTADTSYSLGEWSIKYEGEQSAHGYWSVIETREGDAWRIQLLSTNFAVAPPNASRSTGN
jgi:ketosteroid isomerase-like protein